MLVITLKKDEAVTVMDETGKKVQIVFRLLGGCKSAKVGIDAPEDFEILRDKVIEKRKVERGMSMGR